MENNNTESERSLSVTRADQSECQEASTFADCKEGSIEGVKTYVFSGKFDEIRQDTLILEYIGNDIFLDDNGRKYVYDSKEDSMYVLDEISGEKSYKLN